MVTDSHGHCGRAGDGLPTGPDRPSSVLADKQLLHTAWGTRRLGDFDWDGVGFSVLARAVAGTVGGVAAATGLSELAPDAPNVVSRFAIRAGAEAGAGLITCSRPVGDHGHEGRGCTEFPWGRSRNSGYQRIA